MSAPQDRDIATCALDLSDSISTWLPASPRIVSRTKARNLPLGCEAMTMAEASGEQWFSAETHRVAGEVELLSPERDLSNAEGYFRRALGIARAQQARSWELRAATSLARLWRDQGRRAEAHDLLAPVYGWFTEGFDSLDLKEAKALLKEVA